MGWKFGQTFEMTVVSNVLNYVCIYIYIYIFAATNSFAILFSLPRLTVTETGNSKKRKKKKKKGTLTSNHTLKQQDRGKRYNGLQKKIYDQIGKDTGMVALLMAVLSFVLLPKRSEYL